ncbi:DUF4998 domain-containing protein [Bacteroides sp. 51]|uniref:DUF4998 domain-containing protein n=1 Tax=Bacteroides sp. 51 TaxID=2302938 RepID=UPI0013D5D0E6|nr:DUF4998 domain-containing protein [Bacteroides sp. 51]NDV80403.1 hypothetical protein [Bacteroides sp. 51]
MKKIIQIGCWLLCACAFMACDDLMDTHKEFIEGGEIIYAPKPDTIFFVAGKNRIEANYIISKAPNVNSINIYWNGSQDSLVTTVNLSTAATAGKIVLNNLEEKAYTFTVQLEDKYGHRSLKTTGFGTSYGENYQNSLLGRRINQMESNSEGGVVKWDIAQEGLVYNEIRYKDKQGNTKEVRMEAGERDIFCPAAASGSTIDYRSAYIPEEASIDTFFTAWQNSAEVGMNFPHVYEYADVDRGNWEVLYYDNSDPDEGSVQNMFDNDEGSYWHSNYHDATRFPYTFVIDMKANYWIGRMGAASRQNTHYSKGITYYITEDANYANDPNSNNWIYLGDLDLRQENGWQWSTISEETAGKELRGRYLKVVFTSGHNGEHLGAIAELGVQRISSIDGVMATNHGQYPPTVNH